MRVGFCPRVRYVNNPIMTPCVSPWQEKLRFQNPNIPFTYRIHGYQAVVGPVNMNHTLPNSTKLNKGSSLLVDNRPYYVTILSLGKCDGVRYPAFDAGCLESVSLITRVFCSPRRSSSLAERRRHSSRHSNFAERLAVPVAEYYELYFARRGNVLVGASTTRVRSMR